MDPTDPEAPTADKEGITFYGEGRKSGPFYIHPSGLISWCNSEGELHCTTGPTIYNYPRESVRYYLNGELLSPEEFLVRRVGSRSL